MLRSVLWLTCSFNSPITKGFSHRELVWSDSIPFDIFACSVAAISEWKFHIYNDCGSFARIQV